MVNAVLSGNHFRHRLHQIGAELPHLRVARIAAYPGVAHIKNVVQTRYTTGLVQQGDTLGAAPDVAVHAVAPNIEAGTGGGVRPLGVNHELVCKIILVQPGCSGQIVRPVFPIPGQFLCRLLGKVQVFLCFIWHCVPPFIFRGEQKSERPFQVTRL